MRAIGAKTTGYTCPSAGPNLIRKNGASKAVTSNPSRSYNCLARGLAGTTEERDRLLHEWQPSPRFAGLQRHQSLVLAIPVELGSRGWTSIGERF